LTYSIQRLDGERSESRRWRNEVAFDAYYLRDSIGDYEPRPLHFLTEAFTELLIARAVRPGDVAIDGGANHGYHTRHMLKAVRRRGHVHAFEPNPVLATQLEDWANRRLRVHQVAVGSSNGSGTLYVPIDDDGWGSLTRSHMDDMREMVTFDVRVERIDSLLCSGDAPSFVKLDVELSEDAALEGMGRLLDPSGGPLIVFEAAADNTAANRLQRLGYEVMDLLGRPLDEADHRLVNLLAVPEEHAGKWRYWPDRAAIKAITTRYRAQFGREPKR
jgi:FkbM family methyltransferase